MGPSFRHALAAVSAQAAIAYGYTLTIWSTGAVLMDIDGKPRVVDAFLFILGAVIAFLMVALIATHRLGDFESTGSRKGMVVAGSLHVVSAGVAVGCATIVGEILNGDKIWPFASFAATLAYLMLAGTQLWLAGA